MIARTSSKSCEWIRNRLAASYAGLLTESEEKQYTEHINSCDACKQLHDDYCEGEPHEDLSNGHIPPSMIAKWDDTRVSLQGLERDLVRRHLLECKECRRDLEFLGHQPTLAPAVQARSGSILRSIQRLFSGPDPKGRPFLGVWALAATAAVVLLLVLPWGDDDRQAGGALVPWVAPNLVRGDSSESELLIQPGTRSIVLALRIPSDFPTSSRAQVEIVGPAGKQLARVDIPSTELALGTLMLALNTSDALKAGAYRVMFRSVDGPDSDVEPVETGFSIRLTE